jgi:hypothetical protein
VGQVGELLSAMKCIPRAAVFLICCATSLHGGAAILSRTGVSGAGGRTSLHGGAAIPLEDGRERDRRPEWTVEAAATGLELEEQLASPGC